MSEDWFRLIETDLARSGPEVALTRLGDRLRTSGRYHQLFEARLMKSRFELGLPLRSATPLNELPEPIREQAEAAYLDACREVGQQLLAVGQYRDAWMYLRATGENETMGQALLAAKPNEENIEELIEIALYEGVAPARGVQWMLEYHGTCNAVTTFEGLFPQMDPATLHEPVALVIRHLYDEVLGNVQAHIEQQHDATPTDATLGYLVAKHSWIFNDGNYHVDTSHLASTVRFARLIEDRESLGLAADLAEYGRRLAPEHQRAGEEPFVDFYQDHGRWFAAHLGHQVDEAIEHFRSRAAEVDPQELGSAAIETYLILLCRLGRYDEAFKTYVEGVPSDVPLSPFVPGLAELARQAGQVPRYLEVCRERGDLLGFAAARIDARASRSLP